MKPRDVPLFYAALVIGQIGVWLFAFTLYWLARESSEIHSANIGAGMLGLLSWLLGIVSFVLLVLSFCIKSRK